MRVTRRYTYADIAAIQSGPIADDDPHLNDRRDHIPYMREFEAHDPQTRVLIREHIELERPATQRHRDRPAGPLAPP